MQPDSLCADELKHFQDLYPSCPSPRMACLDGRNAFKLPFRELRAVRHARRAFDTAERVRLVKEEFRELLAFRDGMQELPSQLNPLAPIACLPRDLLEQIFKVYVLDAHRACLARRGQSPWTSEAAFPYGWIKITHVCRYWRMVAIAYSSLWAYVVLNRFPKHSQGIIEIALARSATHPLTIDFAGLPTQRGIEYFPGYWAGGPPRVIMQSISKHLTRVHSLRMTLEACLSLMTADERMPDAPVLEILHVSCERRWIGDRFIPLLQNWSLPKLAGLTALDFTPNLVNALLSPSLTSLSLSFLHPQFTTAGLAQMLQGLPLLESISLEDCEECTQSQLRSAFQDLRTKVSLTHLRRFKYIATPPEFGDFYTVIDVLEYPPSANVMLRLRSTDIRLAQPVRDKAVSSMSKYLVSVNTSFRARCVAIRCPRRFGAGDRVISVSLWERAHEFPRRAENWTNTFDWEQDAQPNLVLYDAIAWKARQSNGFLTSVFSKLDLTNVTTLYVSHVIAESIWVHVLSSARRLDVLTVGTCFEQRGFLRAFGWPITVETTTVAGGCFLFPQLRVLHVDGCITPNVQVIADALRSRKMASLRLEQVAFSSWLVVPDAEAAERLINKVHDLVETVSIDFGHN